MSHAQRKINLILTILDLDCIGKLNSPLKRNKDEFDDSLWGNDKTKFNKRLLSIVNLYKLLGNKSIVKPIYNENSEIDEETTMAVFETFWDNTVVPSWQEDLQYGNYAYSKEQNFLQMITNLVILTQKC